MSRTAIALSVSALLITPASLARASVPDLLGFGARGAAMAGTLTSTASGHEAVYYNPAALAFSQQPSFFLGFQWADFYLSIDGKSVDVSSAPTTLIGFDIPLALRGPLERRLSLGFGFVLPHHAVLVADIPAPGTPHFVRFENRTQTVSIMGALGVRILDQLALGAGFIALSELRGAIDVAPNDAGRIGAEVRDELVADYALIAGAVLAPSPEWSFGLIFRDESSATFDLPITADLGDDFPIEIPALDISGTAQFDPRQLGVAASWRPTPSVLLALDVVYQQWSRFPTPIAYAAVPANFPPQPSPGFSDVVAIRAGAEGRFRFDDLRVVPRGGVAFEPSPVPEQVGFQNYLDNTRIVAAAGAGLSWRSVFLDLAAQAHFLLERTDEKSDATLMADIPGRRPQDQVRHGGLILGLTAELGVKL